MEASEELKAIRKELELSQKAFGEFLGCTRNNVHDYERKKCSVPPAILEAARGLRGSPPLRSPGDGIGRPGRARRSRARTNGELDTGGSAWNGRGTWQELEAPAASGLGAVLAAMLGSPLFWVILIAIIAAIALYYWLPAKRQDEAPAFT